MAEGPPKLAWRPGAIVLFGAGLVLTVGAVVARDPTLLFLALPLLIVPVAAASMVPAPVAPGRLVWRSEGAGPSVSVLGTLTGVPSGTQGSITLGFERPPPLEEEAAPEVVATDEGFRFRLSWRCPYPLLTSVPLPRVVASDPLGLAERILGVAGTPLPIERFPPEAARLGTVQLRRTTPIPGEVLSRATGRTGEFFSVREAAPGDSRREINWRASARRGRTLVNEFRIERTGDLLLVIDRRPSTLGRDHDAELLAIECAAAHGIVRGFLSQKARVGLALYGEFLDVVPLGSGRTHRFRLDRALAAAAVS
ncbi:MAG TPA: DUF58 domain-containing protein, partial [Thermoplasmata archaeon]|nr:DUF58 domain-containing protein [Thermoplasmata archaeon]